MYRENKSVGFIENDSDERIVCERYGRGVIIIFGVFGVA